jgi:hypothetical protein
MISCIICSNNNRLLCQVSKSISETIGVDHEIIPIDNAVLKFGICKAYNLGASKAKFQYLCFIHEDVVFKTKDWGIKLVSHFNEERQAGLLGLAGSIYKTRSLSSWWQPELNGFEPKRINITQSYKYSKNETKKVIINPGNEVRSRVVTLDGVFLASTKETWSKVKFDEKLLTGFHGYDMDFSLTVARSKRLFVIHDIDLEHLSEGRNDLSWMKENLKVHWKHRKDLPITIDGLNVDDIDIGRLDETWQNYWVKEILARELNFPNFIFYYIRILQLNEKFNAWYAFKRVRSTVAEHYAFFQYKKFRSHLIAFCKRILY